MTSTTLKNKNSQSGFAAAEFLFTFVLVISCGLVVFALTFSLMTIEVAQYITWSAARSYSAGNVSKEANQIAGETKFDNLAAAFPLLSNTNNTDWFNFSRKRVGPASPNMLSNMDISNRLGEESRHPWSGVSATIELKLFKSLKVPFLGAVTNDEDLFEFPLHAFLYRNPSQEECRQFYQNRLQEGIISLPDFQQISSDIRTNNYTPHEDNGC